MARSSPLDFGAGSVEVGEENFEGGSRPRRLAITKDVLVTKPKEDLATSHDVLLYAARTYGAKNAYGWRDIVDIHEEQKEVTKIVGGKEVKETKTWKYFQLSDYKYMTFLEVKEAASEVARGLVSLGIARDEVLNIYAATSPSWQLIAHGCSWVSTTIATAYDTLGESGLQHSLNEPECVAVFTNAELLQTLANVVGNVPTLRLVIYDGKAEQAALDKLRATRSDIHLLDLDEMRALGRSKGMETLEDRRPTSQSIACIMYTSGSTGAPKGVVIPHSNLIASLGSIQTILGHHIQPNDVLLAYLPLAHILEFMVELSLFFFGMTFGYGRVKTLTDASVRGCVGDIKALRPTIMIGVPAVWEMIRKGIMAQVNKGSALKKSIFGASMRIKKANIPGLVGLVDSVVLSQIRAATGGRLRLALSGGASLSRETQEFLSLALVTVLQGYGMTETCGMACILPPELMQYGSVGLPMPSMEVRLVDVPEAGYLSTNNPPQGEVWLRGPSVTTGYFKRPDLNDDPTIFTSDGYLRTGDVGQWNKDGTLTLIDRIKNLIKLQGGEYIALERLESVYKACNLVANICVHASAEAKQPLAIVIPHEVHLRHTLEKNPLSGIDAHNTSLGDLCHDDRVKALVMKECNALGKKNDFKAMEMLEAVILTPDEWTPESGLVTAAQKLNRKKVGDTFKAEIEAIYKAQG